MPARLPATVLGLPLDLSRAELTTIQRQWVRNSLVASNLFPVRWRAPALRRLGLKIGRATVNDHCYFGSPRVTIGDGSWINTSVFFDGGGKIIVGPNCAIGMRVILLTTTHELGGPDRRHGANRRLTTRIGAGCWLGAAVTVMPGVTIGDGCVIAAGAVVTKDCEPHGLYAGVPATRIRDLPADVPVTRRAEPADVPGTRRAEPADLPGTRRAEPTQTREPDPLSSAAR